MSQKDNPAQRQKPSLAKIAEVAKTQKKQKEVKQGLLKAYVVFRKEIEVDGVKYAQSVNKRGNPRDPHRHLVTTHTDKDNKWVGKDMTLAQIANTDAFLEIMNFLALVWTEHPSAIKVVEVYLNTVQGKPRIIKYDKSMLVELENLMFNDSAE